MSAPKNLREALPGLRKTVRRFSPYLRRERWLVGGGTAALLGEVVFRLLEPWPLKLVIDGVLTNGSTGLAVLDRLSPTAVLVVAAVATAFAAGGRALLAYASVVALALAGNRVLTAVRRDVYAHLQRLSLRYHDTHRTGDLLTRVTGDIGRLREVIVTAALPMAANVITFVAMAVVMFVIAPRLALLALLALPIFSFTMQRLTSRIRVVARQHRHQEGELASVAAEALGAMPVVTAYSLEGMLQERFDAQNRASLKDGVKAKRLAAGLERRTDLLVGVATGAVLIAGGLLVLAQQLTLGVLVVFLSYLKSSFKPMRDMAKYSARLAKASASGERVVDILATPAEVVDRPGAVEAPPLRGDISLHDVTFGYSPDQAVLREATLHVQAGQRVGLVGPSGAGKSTLLGLLPRLYDPLSGHVTIDGTDITCYTLQSLRAQIALVLQDSLLFAVSVRDNIRFGRPSASDEDVEAAARLANAHEFILQLPNGYDTVIGERGGTLSGGERQRVAIARAAIRDAPIVLLDEPTTGLDGENEREVLEALGRLCEGRTTFVVAHDLAQVCDADQIVVVDDGRIVDVGSHRTLLRRHGLYRSMLALQSAPDSRPPRPRRAAAG